jgi:CBS domain-containing protein
MRNGINLGYAENMPDEQGSSSRSEEDSSRSGLLSGLKNLLFGGDKEPSLREQIEEVIDEAEEEGEDRRGSNIVGDLSPIERKMLRNLLHFGEQTVDDVAVPRGEIIAIPETATFEEVLAIFADAGHSRLPVYRESTSRTSLPCSPKSGRRRRCSISSASRFMFRNRWACSTCSPKCAPSGPILRS